MTLGLEGKVVLITGGSKGIGKALTSAFAEEGARLAICARNEHYLKQTVQEIQSSTRTDIIGVKANMTKLNDIYRFVNAAIRKFNRIDILVNNAGGAHIGGLFQTTDEEWEYHIQLKLLGYIRMTREVVPHMRKAGGGKIINIVGMAAREPGALYMVPGVTNSAIINFTKSLSKELEKDNILVNSVNPATTDTPLTEQTLQKLSELLNNSPEEVRQSVVDSFPQKRLVLPEEVANVVLFLASEAGNSINGVTINVDAGKSNGVW